MLWAEERTSFEKNLPGAKPLALPQILFCPLKGRLNDPVRRLLRANNEKLGIRANFPSRSGSKTLAAPSLGNRRSREAARDDNGHDHCLRIEALCIMGHLRSAQRMELGLKMYLQ